MHSQFKRCALTDRDFADILGKTILDVENFYLLFFLIPSSQISKSPKIWLMPSLGRAGPGLGRVGPWGGPGGFFWVGRVVRGNCELICFLKDCLCAQAPEEPELVRCSTCGEMKDVADMKMVQSEDLINGTRHQTRCRTCTNLRPRLQRLLKPGTEVVRGYEELTVKGRTFVPCTHVAYAFIMLKKIQNPNPFCPKCWQSGTMQKVWNL